MLPPARRTGRSRGWSAAAVAAVLATTFATACGGASSGGSTSSSAPSATTAAAGTPSVTAAATAATTAAAPAAFASDVYPYALTVPAGWQAEAATQAWDGTGVAPNHEDPQSDKWLRPDRAAVFAIDTPTTKRLAGSAGDWVARTAAEHGDTCPNGPVKRETVTIGGSPGVLLAWDCGILINIAVAVHDGAGYAFVFRDPTVHAATDAADKATFVQLLQSVKFSG